MTSDPTSGRSSRQRATLAAMLVLVLGACTAHYPVNAPLDAAAKAEDYTLAGLETARRSDDLLLIVAFSGGGTRAAALAYGVLETLADTTVRIDGRERRLLDEVDIISSVSGGSFTAAYFGLYGDRIFQDYETKFLTRSVQSGLESRLFSPVEWVKLGSSHYDRSDMAADYYDELLFEGKTFRDLYDSGGPLVAINATDIGIGDQFTFIGTQFAPICSDLMSYRVSRAVTASSAVPGPFTSIVMKNYAGSCGYKLPAWATAALRERDITNRSYHQARRLSSYLDVETRPYIHLFDGGISDNLGVRPLLDIAFAEGDIWHKLKAIDLTSTSKLAVIVVDAQHAIDNSFDQRDVALSLVESVETSSGVPLSRYSFETLELLRGNLGRWQKSITAGRCGEKRGSASTGGSAPGDDCAARTYLAEVSFEAVPEKATREHLRALPTSLDLKREDVMLLRKTARTVLEKSRGFQELVQDLR